MGLLYLLISHLQTIPPIGDKLIHTNRQMDERRDRQTDMTKFLGAFDEYSIMSEQHDWPAIKKSFCGVNKSPSAHYLLRRIRLVFVINWLSPHCGYLAHSITKNKYHLRQMDFFSVKSLMFESDL